MPVATRRELLEAGVHFGHQTRRWNPKMGRFIFGERSGIYIIDLEKTLTGLDEAYEFLMDVGRRNGVVLFVGTKKQAQETVAEQASRVGMPYINNRWLGGMLTNFQTIYGRLKRLRELRDMERSGALEFLAKKEALKLRHEKEKLERNLSGIQDMERVPNAIFVIDTKKEHIAVKEARKLGIPVVAIVDSNCDPDEVDYIIPGNDDAIRACSLIAKIVADALQEGQYLAYQGMQARVAGPEFEREPAPGSPTPVDEASGRPQLSEEEAAWMGDVLDETTAVPEAAAADGEEGVTGPDVEAAPVGERVAAGEEGADAAQPPSSGDEAARESPAAPSDPEDASAETGTEASA
ncbi:MAG: 30S ribosomal protein S2 [Actinobacteria bacterium]|nr:30S ribosomal protein S2 [Actinomycetota bacterium]